MADCPPRSLGLRCNPSTKPSTSRFFEERRRAPHGARPRRRPQPPVRHQRAAERLHHPRRPDRRDGRLGPGQASDPRRDPGRGQGPRPRRLQGPGGHDHPPPGSPRQRPRPEPGRPQLRRRPRRRPPPLDPRPRDADLDRPGPRRPRRHPRPRPDRLRPRRHPLPEGPRPRQGGPGDRLRRPRRGVASRGRAEGDPARVRRQPRQPGPLPPRSRDHRRPGASRHRPRLWPGPLRRRPTLLCHAVHQGRQPQARHRRLPRRPVADAGPRRPDPGPPEAPPPVPGRLQRRGLRPQPRCPAPRPQARQRDGRQVRRDPGRRLGPGQVRRPIGRE